ncbi:MAG: hypothetical protein K2Y22_08695 [Candidatus Obscuribacterales bacterium]|nr:hypothetical protein [Candidatus Obscuribacterales bacterium]
MREDIAMFISRAILTSLVGVSLIGGAALADETVKPTADNSPMGFGSIHDQVPVATRQFEFDLNKHLTPLLLPKEAAQRGISLSSTAQIYEIGTNKYWMTNGCVLITSQTEMKVETPVTTVYAKPGTAFIVHNHDNVTRVMNLHDRVKHGVQVVMDRKAIPLNPGEELGVVRSDLMNAQVAASGPNVGYRRMRVIPIDEGYRVFIFEFSIPDALKHCVVFKQLRESESSTDQQLLTEIVKTAAAVDTMFDKSREKYAHYDKDKKKEKKSRSKVAQKD